MKNVQQEAVWQGVINADSRWAFPKEGSFKRRLREIRSNYPRFKKQAKTLQKHIIENFTEERMYSQFCENVSIKREVDLQDLNKLYIVEY